MTWYLTRTVARPPLVGPLAPFFNYADPSRK